MTDYIVPLILFFTAALALGKKENAYDTLLRGGMEGLKLLTAIVVALAIAAPALKNWMTFQRRKAAAAANRKGGN